MTDAASGAGAPRTFEQLMAALRANPADAASWHDIGVAHLRTNGLPDAVAAFRRAVALRPTFAEAHFGLGNALHGQGKLPEAIESFRRTVSLAPGVFSAHLNLGVALYQAAAHADAEAALRAALALDPQSFDAQFALGTVAAAAGRTDVAIAAYRDALRIEPNAPDAHLNLGAVLEQRQNWDEAIGCYRRVIALNPGSVDAYANLGGVLFKRGSVDEAVEAYRDLLKIDPRAASAWGHLGAALKQKGRLDEAIDCYRRVVTLDPASVVAHSDLGVTLCEAGRFDDAIAAHRRALQIDPQVAPVWVNLGIAFGRKGQVDEAIRAYERAIALNPALAEAYTSLGLSLCLKDRLDEGFAVLQRSAELRYGQPDPNRPEIRVLPHKAKHDREQLDHLVENGILGDTARSGGTAEQPFAGLFHLEGGARLAAPALNQGNDIAEIETRWERSKPNIVVVDDLLTPEALDGLRRFCWGSTIWRRANDNGYVGTFLTSGFACPLMAQIAGEIRTRFPGIIHHHHLMDSWAFKYDSRLNGTNIHADFAAVNINFWITPDDASLDPEGGGLIVWDVPAPLDWDFKKYNDNVGGIRDFLAGAGAKSVTIPYRANRAIIFDSDLFHETDRISFKEGYRNRRINVTLLYGLRHDPG